MDNFYERLNQIEERLTPDLLENRGIGNEIGFYIFEYPPERELDVRNHVAKLIAESKHRIANVDLFRLIVGYLKKNRYLDAAIRTQREKGDDELRRDFEGVLTGARLAPIVVEEARIAEHDLVLITGVGNTYPLLRTHNLLNNLQPLMENKPLLVFYPGQYSGQSLSLFGRLRDENYYRAFRLVS